MLTAMKMHLRYTLQQLSQMSIILNTSIRDSGATEASMTQKASCDNDHSNEIGGATKALSVQCLSAQEASCDHIKEPRYAEPQHHSVKNNSRVMDTDDMVIVDLIGLQFDEGVSADTVKVLQLMSTCTSMSGEITAYTSMSIEQLEHAICTEQSNNDLVQQVQQGLATPIENKNNLAGPEMANMIMLETYMKPSERADADLMATI